MVVHLGKKCPSRLLDFAEIDQDPYLIQFGPPQDDFDLPVVAVQVLALTAKVPEVVRGGKIGDDLYFIKGVFQNDALRPFPRTTNRTCLQTDPSA